MHRQRPRLKNGVDFQLQSAFSDGNWPLVSRLAEKRARSLNDTYYEVLKTCAESQADDPSVKFAAVAAVSQFVKDGTVIKDADALDLLEWATSDLTQEDDFLRTIGPLRVRAVKASPKDKHAASRCLESCLIHWDLTSAQQIAAVLDRSFPQERHFMFWNIVITYLLSTSSQATEDKKKLYGTLAFKQIERAAQAAEQAASEQDNVQAPTRSIQKEEEILLLYDIVETHGTAQDFEKLTSSSVYCPLTHFRQGRKEVFLRVIAKYRRSNDWEAVYRLCKDCLSENVEEGRASLLASDYHVWEEFIGAASHIVGVDEAVAETVQNLLLKLVKSPKLPPIYKRNILLARVSAAFQLLPNETDDIVDGKASSTRLQELIRYIEDQAKSPACFDDVKSFVERLDRSGMKYITHEYLPRLYKGPAGEGEARQAHLLSLKVRYLFATCPLSHSVIPGEAGKAKCVTCDTDIDSAVCFACFSEIWKDCLELYQDIAATPSDTLPVDPQLPPELALLLAFCSIKLASLDPKGTLSSVSIVSKRHLFHAILLLEHQRSLSPKNSQLLLVLVQLHLLLGSSPRARQLWEELGVKRTIMDSLAPLFYDRLSTVSPALLSPSDNCGWELMDMLTSHFSYSLKLRMPRRLIDAFEAESYSVILDIPRYIQDLRASATRAISLVEETRSERMLGAPTWELLSDLRFVEVSDDTHLKEMIDYGAFPSWDYSASPAVYTRLRLGPPPSNRRAHLGLLSEAFHDVLGYKPPLPYKVPLSSLASDQVFVIECLGRIGNSFSRFLPDPTPDLTPAEAVYYEVIGLLSTLVSLCAGCSRAPAFEAAFGSLTDSVIAGLEGLRAQIPYEGGSGVEEVVLLLSSMHTVGVYRDAASGISVAARWIVNVNDRARERDRSGQNNLPKDVIARVKRLESAAKAALKEGHEWVMGLKTHLQRDFQERFKNWVFEGAEVLRDAAYQDVVPGLVASMRENAEGWQQVKWE